MTSDQIEVQNLADLQRLAEVLSELPRLLERALLEADADAEPRLRRIMDAKRDAQDDLRSAIRALQNADEEEIEEAERAVEEARERLRAIEHAIEVVQRALGRYKFVKADIKGGCTEKLRGAQAVLAGRLTALSQYIELSSITPLSGEKAFGSISIQRDACTFTLDDSYRTVRVQGNLQLRPNQKRDKVAQLHAGGSDRLGTDHGGHFVARQFGGPTDAINHFAQDAKLNQGAYQSLENEWARALKDGSAVYVDISADYAGDSLRPENLMINYWIDGVHGFQTFVNCPQGQ